jgi:hypothetical protein
MPYGITYEVWKWLRKNSEEFENYRADSPLFTLTLAPDKNLGKDPGSLQADGEWRMDRGRVPAYRGNV